MRDRPKEWEVVCKVCFAGLIMSDEEVERRLNRSENLWPNHCGQVMSLRHIMTALPKEDCNHGGCWRAANAVCGCMCRGRNHGVLNPNPEYTQVKVAEPAWYKKPIRQFISV